MRPGRSEGPLSAYATTYTPFVLTPTSRYVDLDRFKVAQDHHGSFVTAMSELRAGTKATHWIWWTFPQLARAGKFFGLSPLRALGTGRGVRLPGRPRAS